MPNKVSYNGKKLQMEEVDGTHHFSGVILPFCYQYLLAPL